MSMTGDLEAVRDSINSGAIADLPAKRLEEFSIILCRSQAFTHFGASEFPQICETVRAHLLRAHIETLQDHVAELHGHITRLNKSNAKIQWWVIALAVASLIGTVVQTAVAIRGEWQEETKSTQAAQQQKQLLQESPLSIPASPQASGQTTRKSP
jgi:hypothetical protein